MLPSDPSLTCAMGAHACARPRTLGAVLRTRFCTRSDVVADVGIALCALLVCVVACALLSRRRASPLRGFACAGGCLLPPALADAVGSDSKRASELFCLKYSVLWILSVPVVRASAVGPRAFARAHTDARRSTDSTRSRSIPPQWRCHGRALTQVIATQAYEWWGPWGYLVYCGSCAAPFVLVPALAPAPCDARLAWYQRHIFKVCARSRAQSRTCVFASAL